MEAQEASKMAEATTDATQIDVAVVEHWLAKGAVTTTVSAKVAFASIEQGIVQESTKIRKSTIAGSTAMEE